MDSTQSLNSIDDAGNRRSVAWRVFFDATTRLQGVLEARLKKDAGITLSDYGILLSLFEAPSKSLRMGELADRVVFSPSRLTYLVSRLEKMGYVEKAPSDDDGRGYVARLTSQGAMATASATNIHQRAVRELLLDDLTDSEIERIVTAFERVDGRYRSDEE